MSLFKIRDIRNLIIPYIMDKGVLPIKGSGIDLVRAYKIMEGLKQCSIDVFGASTHVDAMERVICPFQWFCNCILSNGDCCFGASHRTLPKHVMMPCVPCIDNTSNDLLVPMPHFDCVILQLARKIPLTRSDFVGREHTYECSTCIPINVCRICHRQAKSLNALCLGCSVKSVLLIYRELIPKGLEHFPILREDIAVVRDTTYTDMLLHDEWLPCIMPDCKGKRRQSSPEPVCKSCQMNFISQIPPVSTATSTVPRSAITYTNSIGPGNNRNGKKWETVLSQLQLLERFSPSIGEIWMESHLAIVNYLRRFGNLKNELRRSRDRYTTFHGPRLQWGDTIMPISLSIDETIESKEEIDDDNNDANDNLASSPSPIKEIIDSKEEIDDDLSNDTTNSMPKMSKHDD